MCCLTGSYQPNKDDDNDDDGDELQITELRDFFYELVSYAVN